MAAAVAVLALATPLLYVALRDRDAGGPTDWNLVLVSVDTLRADHLSS